MLDVFYVLSMKTIKSALKLIINGIQLLQPCTDRSVISILVTVQLYTVVPKVCRWLTNEKQRKHICLTDQSKLA